MRKAMILTSLAAALLLGGVVFALRAAPNGVDGETGDGAKDYVTLNASLDPLISDFDAAKGDVRLVFVAGPSCGPCLRGLDDMNRVVGDMARNNPALKAFILYVPTLGARERDAARAVRLMHGKDIRHYWDPEGQSGAVIQKALNINAYAWDVWLIYDRDAVWTEAGLPPPAYWEHQLGGLPLEKRLDPDRFAAKVAALLNGEEIDG